MQFNLEPPEPFKCPYLKPCLAREAVRTLVAVAVTWLTILAAGCVGRVELYKGGIRSGIRWDISPDSKLQPAETPSPAPAPAENSKTPA